MMRIRSEHVELLRQWVGEFDSEYWREKYLAGDFPRSETVKDLDMRYRWDLFHAARQTNGWDAWREVEAEYVDAHGNRTLTSDHIDTALRRVVPPLKASE